MSEPAPPDPTAWGLTQRQRRLRVLTAVILAVIALMIVVGITQPFFHPVVPHVLSPRLRRAFGVRMLFILGYWTICLLFTLLLVVMAWLDVREVRLRTLMARRDIWRGLAERSQARRSNGANRPH